MSDAERARTVRLPQWLWDELDREALDCRRTSVKQLETVLAAYYRGTIPEVNKEKLNALAGRPVAAKAPTTIKDKTTTQDKRRRNERSS